MEKKRLTREFFARDTLTVAKDLVGKVLVRKIDGKEIRGVITETEAYCGSEDLACHASKGRTPRTEVLYRQAGTIYVYLIYGMYHCVNIVTEQEEFPAAVLVRGIRVEGEGKVLKLNGPGKLSRFLKIDQKFNAKDIVKNTEVWIEDSAHSVSNITAAPRIGIDYAGEYKDKPWRFVLDA